ncbi:MAG: hypothetical protein EA379_09830 [Phycisphaerales bacterium]|nr:MAG: hypothetical protein EA379_09830 [Phycisphaerales bacterium]
MAPASSLNQSRARVPTLVLLEPEQVSLVRAIGSLGHLEFVGVGAPASSGAGAARDAAAALESEPADDFRRALASTEARLVLFAASGASDEEPTLDDPELLGECRERGMKIASIEPCPASGMDLRRFEKQGAAIGADREAVRFVPAMRRSRGFRAAQEVLESMGATRSLSVSMRGGAAHGTLGARLFDAMDLVHTLMGEPETVDAAIIGPMSEGGVRLEAGESLREARGDMTANLRFASARCASIALSDCAGRWFRGATLVAQRGCLRVDDKSFELIEPSGETADRSRSRLSTGSADDPPAAAAIADQITQLLDPRAAPMPPSDLATVLAMCEAALLSARTGQPESPATLLRMAQAR